MPKSIRRSSKNAVLLKAIIIEAKRHTKITVRVPYHGNIIKELETLFYNQGPYMKMCPGVLGFRLGSVHLLRAPGSSVTDTRRFHEIGPHLYGGFRV